MQFRNSHACCGSLNFVIAGLKIKYQTDLERKGVETGSRFRTEETDKISLRDCVLQRLWMRYSTSKDFNTRLNLFVLFMVLPNCGQRRIEFTWVERGL